MPFVFLRPGNKKRASFGDALLTNQVSSLELEANRQLNLSLTEEESVRQIARGTKRWVEGSVARTGRSTAAGDVVDAAINASDLGSVENVEPFSKHLDLSVFFYRKSSRNAQIYVIDSWRVEVIDGQESKA